MGAGQLSCYISPMPLDALVDNVMVASMYELHLPAANERRSDVLSETLAYFTDVEHYESELLI